MKHRKNLNSNVEWLKKKDNLKGKFENLECNFCDEEETQKHILECNLLNKQKRN